LTSAQIINLKNAKDVRFLNPEYFEELVCSGPIDTHCFVTNILTPSKYLTKLYLCGSFWKSLDLPENKNLPTKLEHLRAFVVQVHCEDILNQGELQDFVHSQALFVPSLSKLNQFDKNLSIILNSIHSTKLEAVEIRTGIEVVREPPETLPYNWRYQPLELFLERHQTNMRELCMPSFVGKMCADSEPRVVPHALNRLNLRSQKIWFQNGDYWKQVVMSQTKLQHVNLKFVDYPGRTLSLIVCCVAVKNPNLESFTMRFTKGHAVASGGDQEDPQILRKVTLDAKGFQNCEKLTTFILDAQKNQDVPLYDSILDNFSDFPKNLKKISISGVIISNLQANDVHKFPHLEYLSLGNIALASRTGFCATELCNSSYYYGGVAWESLEKIQPFISNCLQHRKLSFLCLRFWKNPPISKELREFFEALQGVRGYFWNFKWLRSIHISFNNFLPSCPCSVAHALQRRLYGTFEVPDNMGTNNVVFVENVEENRNAKIQPLSSLSADQPVKRDFSSYMDLCDVVFTINDNTPDESDYYCYEAENLAKLGYPPTFYEDETPEEHLGDGDILSC